MELRLVDKQVEHKLDADELVYARRSLAYDSRRRATTVSEHLGYPVPDREADRDTNRQRCHKIVGQS
jgi:hypothetical protein